MKRMLQRSICLLGMLIILTNIWFVFAEDGTQTGLTLQPQQDTVETGRTVELTLTVEQTDQPLVGCMLQFTAADGYQFDSLRAGPDIQASELSYSFDGEIIVLLYIDNDLGNSPAGEGSRLAVISLTAVEETEAAPLVCTATDVVGGNLQQTTHMDVTVSAGMVKVTGPAVQLPAPTPHYAEEGGEPQPMPEQPAQNLATPELPPAAGDEPAQEIQVDGGQNWEASAKPSDPEPAAWEAGSPASQAVAETQQEETVQTQKALWPWLIAALAAAAAAVIWAIRSKAKASPMDK